MFPVSAGAEEAYTVVPTVACASRLDSYTKDVVPVELSYFSSMYTMVYPTCLPVHLA